MGRAQSLETRRKISEAKKGKPLSEAHRKKMSERMKGKTNTFYGKRHTKKSKKLMSDATLGEKNVNFGKKFSKETRKKMSDAQRKRQPALTNRISHQGYREIKCYVDSYKNNYKFEHRAIMENHLGRKLESNELIHHIDFNKLNNNINNLMIVNHTEHYHLHNNGKNN